MFGTIGAIVGLASAASSIANQIRAGGSREKQARKRQDIAEREAAGVYDPRKKQFTQETADAAMNQSLALARSGGSGGSQAAAMRAAQQQTPEMQANAQMAGSQMAQNYLGGVQNQAQQQIGEDELKRGKFGDYAQGIGQLGQVAGGMMNADVLSGGGKTGIMSDERSKTRIKELELENQKLKKGGSDMFNVREANAKYGRYPDSMFDADGYRKTAYQRQQEAARPRQFTPEQQQQRDAEDAAAKAAMQRAGNEGTAEEFAAFMKARGTPVGGKPTAKAGGGKGGTAKARPAQAAAMQAPVGPMTAGQLAVNGQEPIVFGQGPLSPQVVTSGYANQPGSYTGENLVADAARTLAGPKTEPKLARPYARAANTLEARQAADAAELARLQQPMSDEESKDEIEEGSEEMARNAPGYEYEYKQEHQGKPGTAPGKHYGVMAQDLEKTDMGSEMVDEDEDGMKRVDTERLTMANTAALNKVFEKLDELEGKKKPGKKSGKKADNTARMG